jgi:hypothetical protein
MERNVLGEFRGFTLIYEEILNGGIEVWVLLGVWAGVHGGALRRGGPMCVSFVFLREFYLRSFPACEWGDLKGGVRGGFPKSNTGERK